MSSQGKQQEAQNQPATFVRTGTPRPRRYQRNQFALRVGSGRAQKYRKFLSQILERVKPDRVTVTKPEEDRRRRTIIVEKNNNSYGFTLQSYGIHYKKEQEIEMITYVDYVEYDGPAYRAGMREGDVILSINGHDMEKTDHKTLVNFIKNCDSRMRMVVLFEDCVRKVELHMRYIQLQRLLQTKMSELERICVREKELMEGKWKTHSLPARKKGSKVSESSPQKEIGEIAGYCRPTVSTEDVARATPPPGYGPPIILAYRPYQYVDQHGRAYIIQGPHNSSEYIAGWPGGYSRSDGGKGIVRRCSATGVLHESRGYHQTNGMAAAANVNSTPTNGSKQSGKVKSSSSRHHCNPCIQSATSPQDNTSLEAYDLASPCCNSHCVPSRRRRHHHKPKKSTSVESARGSDWKEKSCSRSTQPSGYVSSGGSHNPSHRHHHHHHQTGRRYFNLVSQCSLHSCTSSEVNSGHEKGHGNDSSTASYTTSLSTDTLYWEPTNNEITRQHSVKSNSSSHEPSKPKSWDNLTTKAFGGYGFGYSYMDRNQKPQSTKANAQKPPKYVQPTKSSESLLLLPEYPTLSDSSLSCECLDATSPTPNANDKNRFYTLPQGEQYYHRDKASQTERRIVNVQQQPEVTRL
ncbi:SH3 and multiple ankyrin repeat domains protein 1 isoform X2 [Cimex lectularius]|uniref:PDZ domain-containing protein n=1 Tax=Cimex lectularius TaxID=79782 RepID=A0A8I6TCB7_CIMLE|nr:SH3 and multiple ankyrin repeat domains protein 1 isoform X2 [Cimex lectularius]